MMGFVLDGGQPLCRTLFYYVQCLHEMCMSNSMVTSEIGNNFMQVLSKL